MAPNRRFLTDAFRAAKPDVRHPYTLRMRTDIDISILTDDQAIGRVHGALDFPAFLALESVLLSRSLQFNPMGSMGSSRGAYNSCAGIGFETMLLFGDVVASSRLRRKSSASH